MKVTEAGIFCLHKETKVDRLYWVRNIDIFNIRVIDGEVNLMVVVDYVDEFREGHPKSVFIAITVLRNTSMPSWQGMNRGWCSCEPESKEQSTVWVFKAELNPTKVVCAFLPVFGEKLELAQLYHQNNAEQEVLIGAHTLVYQLSLKKSSKPTAEDGSLYATTLRALTHGLKKLNFWALKTSV